MSSSAIFAKNTLTAFLPQIDEQIRTWWSQEKQKQKGSHPTQQALIDTLIAHLRDHSLRPSKRLRSALVISAYRLGGQPLTQVVWDAAVAVELVHTALLIKDDWMDQDTQRRGAPTTHVWYSQSHEVPTHIGDTMAICASDYLLTAGYDLMSQTGSMPALRHMLCDIQTTTFGQAYDMALSQQTSVSEAEIIALHQAKTAVYTYQNPLLIGACLSDLTVEVQRILQDYSMAGGVAFQLQDDMLGVFGNSADTGKSVDSDLLQGKRTLLITKTMQLGSPSQQHALRSVWGKGTAASAALDLARQAIKDSGAYAYNQSLAKHYAHVAADQAQHLRSMALDSAAIDFLQGIAEYMVEREV